MPIDTIPLQAADRSIAERYLTPGVLPGFSWSVIHGDEVVHTSTQGYDADAIFRIYSMTKPITSVAMLILIERGLCRLADPVHKWLPGWDDLRVYQGGSGMAMATTGCARPMNIQDLFTHTSGLTYGWMFTNPIDAAYRKRGIGARTTSLEEMCARLTEVPLMFSPGTAWQYSISTDVLGHLVELISGTTLNEFFAAEILGPLGMGDSAFWVDNDNADRLVPNTAIPSMSPFGVPPNAAPFGKGDLVIIDDNREGGEFRQRQPMLSGGGGLTSTLGDYVRFCRMILNGGELDGARILGDRTVRYAGLNHLPEGGLLSDLGEPISSETDNAGMGFGLGFSVVMDPAQQRVVQSEGTLAWGGAASTLFWIDPKENLAVVGMTQVMPSWATDLRDELRQVVYGALR